MATAAASSPSSELRRIAEALLTIVLDVASGGGGDGFLGSPIRGDCVRLARKVSLLAHLIEEIRDFAVPERVGPGSASSSSSAASPSSCLVDLLVAIEAAKRFLLLGGRRRPPDNVGSDLVSKDIAVQLQFVTWQLEKALGNLPYEYFEVSDEVQEEVELVRAQLRRATERNGTSNLKIFQEIYHILSSQHGSEVKRQLTRSGGFQVEKNTDPDCAFHEIVTLVVEVNGKFKGDAERITSNLIERLGKNGFTDPSKTTGADTKPTNSAKGMPGGIKRSDSLAIPEDFRCPISLELMRDPVIVSTGQTYERSFIQKWIDCGNRTCPKTQQKLQNLTLTPNYVLRSLIMQWCETNRIEQPRGSMGGLIRKSDGTFQEINGDRDAISVLIHNLSSISMEERKSAAAEIRSLAKRSTDNRILIGEGGAIPSLVNLLYVEDPKTQEHAVTSLLNLSIYDTNKERIMMAGAVIPIIDVLRKGGSMEARENAAAAIFSLSLNDANKITIGGTPGAIESLVDLLKSGSPRGKKDAATALFNLCIYQGNKARALRAGILTALLQLLKDPSSNGMVDEALTILTVLVSHQEGKVSIAKANTIPLLIDLLRTGQPRNKENAASILLALCKKDAENLACLGRLGALIPLTELAKSGTERAKRKANSLMEHLSKMQML